MIYIWDNGGCYSSHSIEFIDVPDDADVDQVKLCLLEKNYDQPEILGIAERVEWRDGRATPFVDWMDSSRLLTDGFYDDFHVEVKWPYGDTSRYVLSDLAHRLSEPFIQWLLSKWEQDPRVVADPRLSAIRTLLDRPRTGRDAG